MRVQMSLLTRGEIADAARQAFARLWRAPAEGVVFAPGRVNLIGEHTDYNDGFVLPMAIQEGIAAAFRGRADSLMRVHSANISETREIDLTDLEGEKEAVTGWFRYVAGVAWAMQSAGLVLAGVDVALAATLPSGAGLSSSAALELSIARTLAIAAGIPWDPRAAARMAQRAEHEFAGVACGIMDQMAVACAHDGKALLLDCRSLETSDVALPPSARIVIINSGVRRSLSDSAYNDRRGSCERAVAAVRQVDPLVRALRDVDDELLARAGPLMDETTFRRASHVVTENARPGQLSQALAANDLAVAGKIMVESHESLRDLYEVSCPELDVLVELSCAQQGCHGARLTGAGFGGCAIALVDADRVQAFAAAVASGYAAATRSLATIIVSRPSGGTRLID
jgi:galactokinase